MSFWFTNLDTAPCTVCKALHQLCTESAIPFIALRLSCRPAVSPIMATNASESVDRDDEMALAADCAMKVGGHRGLQLLFETTKRPTTLRRKPTKCNP